MSETKIYELYLSLIFKIFIFGMFGLLLAIGIILIVVGIISSAEDRTFYLIMGIFMTIIPGWNLLYIFSFPHRITVSETGEITLISLLRRRHTSISEIVSIKPDASQFFGFLVIRTQKKKIKILNQFDGFHDFILRLKTQNPSVELRGC